MKPICINCGVFLTGIELQKTFDGVIDVLSYGHYCGMIVTEEYRLRHKFNTQDTKYYTIEKRV